MLLCANCGRPASHALLPYQVYTCKEEACELSAYLNAAILKDSGRWVAPGKIRKVPVNTGRWDMARVMFDLDSGYVYGPESTELILGDWLLYRSTAHPSFIPLWDWAKAHGIGIRDREEEEDTRSWSQIMEEDIIDHPE